MALRELLLKLGIDVDPSGVKKADAALGTIKKAAIAAAVAFAAIKAVKGIASIVDDVRGVGDELDKTSQQLGISTDALQEWRFAAKLAGASSQGMSNALAKLQKNAFDAATGGTEMADDFKALGVDVLDSSGEIKDASTLMADMADGFARLTNSTEKSALAQSLMGRAGKSLIPLLNGGSKAIAEMRAEAQALGGIMSKELIAKTVKLTDDQLKSQEAWKGLKNDLAGKIIPVLIKVANASVKIAKAIRGPLNKAFDIIGAGINVVVNIVETIIETFGNLDGTFEKLIVTLGLLGIAFVLIGKKGRAAAIKMAINFALAALPIILIAALIAIVLLAIDDFITFMKGGDSVIGRLIDRFKKWVDEMGGIGEAIKKVFSKVFQFIFNVSKEKADKIIQSFINAKEAIAESFDDLSEGLSEVFLFIEKVIIGFKDGMTAAIDFVINKFEALTDAIADAIGAVADFVGLGEDVAEGTSLTQEEATKRQTESFRNAEKTVELFKKLEKEGFGTAVIKRDEGGRIISAGLTGARAGAQERLAQLQQNINAPLTINVDASGQSNPDAIARSIVTQAAPRIQSNRQTALGFQTDPV